MPPPPVPQASSDPFDGFQRPWRAANEAWAVAVLLALGLSVLMHGYNVVANLRVRGMLLDRDYEAIVGATRSIEALPAVSFLLTLVTAVVLMVWVHHVWTSERSHPGAYTRSTGIAVGGWIIPLANYVLAPLAIRDLWRGTRAARPGASASDLSLPMPGLVMAWAVFWAAGNLLLAISSSAARGAENEASWDFALDRIDSSLMTEAAASVAMIVAGILLIRIVWQIRAFTRR
jgi:hypothetical protein